MILFGSNRAHLLKLANTQVYICSRGFMSGRFVSFVVLSARSDGNFRRGEFPVVACHPTAQQSLAGTKTTRGSMVYRKQIESQKHKFLQDGFGRRTNRQLWSVGVSATWGTRPLVPSAQSKSWPRRLLRVLVGARKKRWSQVFWSRTCSVSRTKSTKLLTLDLDPGHNFAYRPSRSLVT